MRAGLPFSKITIVLSRPGILFVDRRGLLTRGATTVVPFVVVPALVLVGVGVGERAIEQRFRATSGNLWFLLSMLMGVETASPDLTRRSMMVLVCVLISLCMRFCVGRVLRGQVGLDSAAAFVGSVNLIFMMLAYKTYPW